MGMTNDDIGLAILEHLCIEKKGRVGYFFTMNKWLRDYIKDKQAMKDGPSMYNTWIVREVILDLERVGYIQVMSMDQLQAYGRGIKDKPTGIELTITWSGKAWYHEHIQKGVLSEREWYWFKVLFVVTVIGTLASFLQFLIEMKEFFGLTGCHS
jgi:hypothetical protein